MKYKKILFKIIFLVFFIFLSLNVFAYNNLEFKQITKADILENNSFYLCKNNCTKDIVFNIKSNYEKKDLQTIKDPRIEIEKVNFNSSKNLNTNLSFKSIDFKNKINTNLLLHIRTHGFEDQKVNLKLKASVYDEYNNLIDSKNIYLKFISNNSKYYYLHTKNHNIPKLDSYSLDRDFFILRDSNDYDVISIKTDYNNILNTLDIRCDLDNNLDYKVDYISKNIVDLNIFIKEGKILSKERYVLDCNFFDKFGTYSLHDLFVERGEIRDSNILCVKDDVNSLDQNISKNSFSSKLTGLFSFKKLDFGFSFLLLFIVVLLLVTVFFLDKK